MSPFLTFLSSLEAFHDIATAVDTKKSRLKRLAGWFFFVCLHSKRQYGLFLLIWGEEQEIV